MTASEPLRGEGPLPLLGGTFDPIHFGHLRPAEEVRAALGAERFLLIPCGDPPHRDSPLTSAEHRLALTRAAVEGREAAEVLDWEVRAEGPSYTVRTLEWLRERLGRRPIVTMIGSDAFTQLHHWHQWQRLLELTHIAALRRPGAPLQSLEEPLATALAGRWAQRPEDLAEEPAGRVMAFDVTRLDISATEIRQLVAAGRSPRFLLPRTAEDYIAAHELYRQAP